MLNDLEGLGKLTETGWHFEPKDLNEWRIHLQAFLKADNRYRSAKQWCLGDAFNNLKWGDRRQECERLGLNYHSISEYCKIASIFKFSVRTPNLSFTHHKMVAYNEDREKILKEASKKKLTVKELQELINSYKPKKKKIIEPPLSIQQVYSHQEQHELADIPEQEEIWSDYELKAWDELLSGRAVLANRHTDINLIEKAKRRKKLLYAGRGMHNLGWGNPFLLDIDGTRDEVCDLYEKYFWMKKSLYNNIEKLKGKVILCSCRPKRCHGDFLVKLANGEIKNLDNRRLHIIG